MSIAAECLTKHPANGKVVSDISAGFHRISEPVERQVEVPVSKNPVAPTFRQIVAATLEYFSMMPSCALLFELLPMYRLGLHKLAGFRVVCFPLFLRLWIARVCPEYDPYLKAWPRTTGEYNQRDRARKRRMAGVRKMVSSGRWLDAYEYWWACRRPATRRRLTLPLYTYLGGDRRAFMATLGVFAWSGLLHALWYPLLPVYACLDSPLLALKVFLSLWLSYSLLGVPVAINKKLKKINIMPRGR